MEKKQGISKEEMRQLVESHSWIKSPFAYTKLGANLSLVQQQSLLMVSDHLQTYIKDFYNLKLDKSKKRPKSIILLRLFRMFRPSRRRSRTLTIRATPLRTGRIPPIMTSTTR